MKSEQPVHSVEHYLGTQIDFAALKRSRVEGPERISSFGLKPDLDDHIAMLHDEFIGRSRLEFYNVILTVLLRRGYNTSSNFLLFRRLWNEEANFLVGELDSRWLISACDTFTDHSEDKEEIAFACAGTLFMNTVKLYETERHALGATSAQPYKEFTGRVSLFDGLTAFMIGNGDMIKNLAERLRKSGGGCPTALIVQELFRRAQQNDTVYRRFRVAHKNFETAW